MTNLLGITNKNIISQSVDYVNTATCEIDNNKLKLLTYKKTQLTYPSKIWRMVQHEEISTMMMLAKIVEIKNRLELSGRFLEYVKYLNVIENILAITGWNQKLHSMAKHV